MLATERWCGPCRRAPTGAPSGRAGSRTPPASRTTSSSCTSTSWRTARGPAPRRRGRRPSRSSEARRRPKNSRGGRGARLGRRRSSANVCSNPTSFGYVAAVVTGIRPDACRLTHAFVCPRRPRRGSRFQRPVFRAHLSDGSGAQARVSKPPRGSSCDAPVVASRSLQSGLRFGDGFIPDALTCARLATAIDLLHACRRRAWLPHVDVAYAHAGPPYSCACAWSVQRRELRIWILWVI
mmetsp:Transcript_63312/g.196418  ORF Transcript_63312/g.196418 Transcript_63312/m.196418 type:complete len:238 (+) Transcript_63312:141-854(+)